MPLIYRVMTRDGDKPKLGDTARALGVRLPPSGNADIDVDDAGYVAPGRGGMSVAPNLQSLPIFRVPTRYHAAVPAAHGKSEDACWRMGEGPFAGGAVATGLALRGDTANHGLVEPAFAMPVAEYQASLAATRDAWHLVEP